MATQKLLRLDRHLRLVVRHADARGRRNSLHRGTHSLLDVSEPLCSVEDVGVVVLPHHLGFGRQPPLCQPNVVISTRTISTVFGLPRNCEKMSALGNGEQPDMAVAATELNAEAGAGRLGEFRDLWRSKSVLR